MYSDGSGPVKPITDILGKFSMPIIIGGDFNMYDNPFESLENLSGSEPTFYNDQTAKFDFIVGKDVNKIQHFVNPIDSSKGRWPNVVEGSDHTAVFVKVLLP